MQLDSPTGHASPRAAPLAARYAAVRRLTGELCRPLSAEDMLVQSMPQASPAKWHLAHTTWFFETFILRDHLPHDRPFDERFGFLFNSYYNAVGERLGRQQRGSLSRPSLDEVLAYRAHVDARMARLLASPSRAVEELTRLGINHEQQHQELLLTDIKHALGSNPLRPAYRDGPDEAPRSWPSPSAIDHPGGLCEIGHAGPGFAYDNESPRHAVYLRPFRLAARPVVCGEYLRFMESGGYDRPDWWLSDGWDACARLGWRAPLYWEKCEGRWLQYTLAGPRPVRDDEPACHVSFYEADAFARWSGARLPTEAEWEAVAAGLPLAGSFLDAGRLHPAAGDGWFGESWQWTASPYVAYPGYRPPQGALGEYNGKFMCNQLVLRGGSCATPRDHFRVGYRNFFPPETRWQFAAFRLAWDA